MVPFSSLFLLDSATLSFASMATVVYGYVNPQEFRLLGLCFAFCGGSLWALFTPGLCFLVFPVLSSSAWFVGCDGAKLWFTAAAVDSAVLVMLLSSVYLPASASADFINLDQLGILEACLLSVLVGVIFFSSRPNKASTAGMSAGNRNIGLNLLLEWMLCICCMLRIFVALFQFAVNRFECSLLLLSEDWDCSIFFLFFGVVVADGSVCGLVLFYFFHSFLVLQCFHHWIMWPWGYQSNLGEVVSLAVLSFATIRIRVVHVCACPIEYVHGTTYVKLYVWFESLPLEMR